MSRNSEFEKLASELKRLRADVERVSNATERYLRSAGEDAVESGQEAWSSARDTIERKIEERPLGAAAIALGIGMVLGIIFGGRR